MIAISLGERNTDMCLQKLHKVKHMIDIAEVCLDLMSSFDLKRLISESPCPLIISYRPLREGGMYRGTEKKRIEILKKAVHMSVAYVDIEWDSIDEFYNTDFDKTKVIISRHWFDYMPELSIYYEVYKKYGDIVKLVGMPKELSDNLNVLELLKNATTSVIGIGMGNLGHMTRILAPCFKKSFLTFGSVDGKKSTAPGQLSIEQMINTYHVNHLSLHTHVKVELFTNCKREGIYYIKEMGDKYGEKLSIALFVFPYNFFKVKECLKEYFDISD